MTPEESARDSRPFPDPEHSITPRKPRTFGGVVYLVVLALTSVGILLVVIEPWRPGLVLIGAACVLGGLARLLVRDHASGMLGVRSKMVDVAWLIGLGTTLCVLALALRGGPR